MELMMTWTDERLEERFAHIDTRFDRLEAVAAAKSETRELRSDIQELKVELGDVKGELRDLRESIQGIHLMIHRDHRGILLALIAAIAAILVKGG